MSREVGATLGTQCLQTPGWKGGWGSAMQLPSPERSRHPGVTRTAQYSETLERNSSQGRERGQGFMLVDSPRLAHCHPLWGPLDPPGSPHLHCPVISTETLFPNMVPFCGSRQM